MHTSNKCIFSCCYKRQVHAPINQSLW